MKTLFEAFQELKKSYYDVVIDATTLFPVYSQKDNCECKEFIKEHFERGNKKKAFDIDFWEKYCDQGKHTHTTALYLLGMLFESLFYSKIKADLEKKKINAEGWYNKTEFLYTWYLTCLYHDTASCIEKTDGGKLICCNDCIKQMKSYKEFIDKKNILRFSENLIQNYCRYRVEHGSLDHGIYGGMMLFERLLLNFREQTKGHDWRQAPELIKSGLTWRMEHPDHFAYVADAIICHNMWTVRNEDRQEAKCYRKYHLDELIIEVSSNCDNRLSVDDYPLHFMLCFLDTIEPVKRFSELSAYEVLNNISINWDNMVEIGWHRKIEQKKGFSKWKENILGLDKWMCVNVSQHAGEAGWRYIAIKL